MPNHLIVVVSIADGSFPKVNVGKMYENQVGSMGLRSHSGVVRTVPCMYCLSNCRELSLGDSGKTAERNAAVIAFMLYEVFLSRRDLVLTMSLLYTVGRISQYAAC